MASNQDQASYRVGEAKGHIQEKAGQVTGAAKETAYEVKDRAAGAAGKGQGATEAAKQKASEAAQYTQDRTTDTAQYTRDSAVAGKDNTGSVLQQAGGQVMGAVFGAKDAVVNTLGMGGDKKADAGSAATTLKDRTVESKDQTGGFLGEKTASARQKAAETTEAAKQKASEAAQYTKDRTSDAAPYTKDSAVAGKDNTGNVLQQAGEQVMGAVVGARDAVASTLGMGGDKANAGSGATKTKDTSVTEKITGDH